LGTGKEIPVGREGEGEKEPGRKDPPELVWCFGHPLTSPTTFTLNKNSPTTKKAGAAGRRNKGSQRHPDGKETSQKEKGPRANKSPVEYSPKKGKKEPLLSATQSQEPENHKNIRSKKNPPKVHQLQMNKGISNRDGLVRQNVQGQMDRTRAQGENPNFTAERKQAVTPHPPDRKRRFDRGLKYKTKRTRKDHWAGEKLAKIENSQKVQLKKQAPRGRSF